MKMMRDRRSLMVVATLVMVVSFFPGGCTWLKPKQDTGAGATGEPPDSGPSPFYYDFGDVLIPSEMKIQKDESFVYRTPGFSAGMILLKGRVEPGSLITFFENNMAKDNWRLMSAFKAKRSIMLFHKENRWCVISILEKEFNTYAELWVAPTVSGSETDLMR